MTSAVPTAANCSGDEKKNQYAAPASSSTATKATATRITICSGLSLSPPVCGCGGGTTCGRTGGGGAGSQRGGGGGGGGGGPPNGCPNGCCLGGDCRRSPERADFSKITVS